MQLDTWQLGQVMGPHLSWCKQLPSLTRRVIRWKVVVSRSVVGNNQLRLPART